MLKNHIKNSTKVIVFLTYLLMIATNAMATLLPLNGKPTAAISDAYFNLFAPAGITFAIWGVIYLLLFIFVLYIIGFFNRERNKLNPEILNRIGLVFSLTSIANAAWLFAWHWERFLISVFIMLIMLMTLIYIVLTIKGEELNTSEKLFIKIPFSVYFGWITIATIANITTYLVSINWQRFGLTEVIWTVLIIVVGLLIGLATMLINQDKSYGLVFIWAYTGILIKHVSTDGFSAKYPSVMITIIISLIALVLAQAYLIFYKEKTYKFNR